MWPLFKFPLHVSFWLQHFVTAWPNGHMATFTCEYTDTHTCHICVHRLFPMLLFLEMNTSGEIALDFETLSGHLPTYIHTYMNLYGSHPTKCIFYITAFTVVKYIWTIEDWTIKVHESESIRAPFNAIHLKSSRWHYSSSVQAAILLDPIDLCMYTPIQTKTIVNSVNAKNSNNISKN